MTASRDSIYAYPLNGISDFKFDDRVAAVFPDMIRRSVPGYSTITSMLGIFAEQYMQPNSNCYDLGCSLGAATLAIRHHIRQPNCKIYGVDNSYAMLERCCQHIAFDSSHVPVRLICADIFDVTISTASMVVLNFTLQFIKPKKRSALIRNSYNGLLPKGVLLLAEKVAFAEHSQNDLHTNWHYAFKRAQGYSDLEISQKRTALENVMVPETITTHEERLLSAGFSRVEVWFQCFNFVAMIAFK